MNQTQNYEFTIVVPVFNEEDCMDALCRKLEEYLPTALCKSCVLFVNDGSTDKSLEKIQSACQSHPGFFYLSYNKNSGKSAALKAGFDACFSEYIGYIDADLQTLPEDFNTLLEYRKEYTLVAGIRMNRQDTRSKKIQSKIGNAFRRSMTHDGAIDTGCPLKVMRTDAAKKMPFFTGTAPARYFLSSSPSRPCAVTAKANRPNRIAIAFFHITLVDFMNAGAKVSKIMGNEGIGRHLTYINKPPACVFISPRQRHTSIVRPS